MDFMTLLSPSELPLSSVKISFITSLPEKSRGGRDREKEEEGKRGRKREEK